MAIRKKSWYFEVKNTKEWIEKRDIFIKNKKCCICSSIEFLSIHHLKSYITKEEYMSLESCVVLCKDCHHKVSNLGYHICYLCKKALVYKQDKCENCRKIIQDEKISSLKAQIKEQKRIYAVPIASWNEKIKREKKSS